MKKHRSIRHFVQLLKKSTKFETIEFVNSWDGDLCAMGLKRGERLVYVCTFPYKNETQFWCDVDFEIVVEKQPEISDVIKTFRKISGDDAIREMKSFLDV